MTPNLYEITEAMLRYGGSVVHFIGAAMRVADQENIAKLEAAFPELIEEYRALANLAKARRGA